MTKFFMSKKMTYKFFFFKMQFFAANLCIKNNFLVPGNLPEGRAGKHFWDK